MPTIGIVAYSNSLPLTKHLPEEWQRKGHPKDVALWLEEDSVHVALAPVGAALTNPNVRILPGFCIGAEGPVNSVFLVAETPIEQWTHVALDGVSRTSVLLAKLLLTVGPLADRVSDSLIIKDVPPESGVRVATTSTASVVIGDAARRLPDRLTTRIDLAEVWTQWTGLPFVFAVWATNRALAPEIAVAIEQAGRRGVSELAEESAHPDHAYWTQNIRYPLDDRALMGLRRFVALINRSGLATLHDPTLLRPPALIETEQQQAVSEALAQVADGAQISEEQLRILAYHGRTIDLLCAADLVRQSLNPGISVPWSAQLHLNTCTEKQREVAATLGVKSGVLTTEEPDLNLKNWLITAPISVLLNTKCKRKRLAPDPVGCVVPRVRQALSAVRGVDFTKLTPVEDEINAKKLGYEVLATLVIGQGETIDERIERLILIEEAHQKAPYVAFTCWAGHLGGAVGAEANTAMDHLRWTALSRLYLSIEHFEAAPDHEGLGMAQASLNAGCDSFGTYTLTGKGDSFEVQLEKLVHTISMAHRTAVRADDDAPEIRPGRRRQLRPSL